MKHRTKLFALLLAGSIAVTLTACPSSEEAEVSPTAPAESPAASATLPPDFVADPDVEDLCLATAGIPGDFELFTIDGIPVSARAYLYWLAYHLSYSSPSPKEDAFQAAAQYALVPVKAQELGYELTQDQIDELESSLVYAQIMMGGEEAFMDKLRQVGLDYDSFYDQNVAPYYYDLLVSGLFADRPTAEEMDEYIEENDILYAKHILLMTVDPITREPLDEAAIAEKKATAEEVLSQLQNSADLLTDFDTLMFQYSEDSGLVSNPDGYTFTAGTMVAEFENATRALEYGQISDLVESTFGYHIILRLDPDTEENRANLRYDLMTDQLTAWIDEADTVFTEEYQALDPELFFLKFMAYQDAFTAASAAEDGDAAGSAGVEGDGSPEVSPEN